MSLIEQIISDLTDDQKSLTSALLKTKVLASKIQNNDLYHWVSCEINGYEKNDKLPPYRCNIPNHLKGTMLNGYTKYSNVDIPTSGLGSSFEDKLRSMDFPDSVSGLEKLINVKTGQRLTQPFRAEIRSMVESNWQSMGNPYLQLISLYREISNVAIVEILSNVRNKLLDMMLEIDQKFGHINELKELKSKNDEIRTIMNHTIINNSGDGNILNTGNEVVIKAEINITKQNKESLSKHLSDNGVNVEDISQLIELIDDEEPDYKSKTFGHNVNEWTKKMLGKALDGSWTIGVGAAGSLLADAIGKYYGFK